MSRALSMSSEIDRRILELKVWRLPKSKPKPNPKPKPESEPSLKPKHFRKKPTKRKSLHLR